MEKIIKREGNLVLKKRGGNWSVYLLPYMEHLNMFIDETSARLYYMKLKKELFG